LEESALFATKIAAKSVTGYGRDQYPTKEDLENFFNCRLQSADYRLRNLKSEI